MMTALAPWPAWSRWRFAFGAGSQMLQPLAIAVIGGILISMVLSLIITPAVHFYLSGRTAPVPKARRQRSRKSPGTQCRFLRVTSVTHFVAPSQ